MAAVRSETSVNFYLTTQRNNSEDSHLYAHKLFEMAHLQIEQVM
jgi:hypothetical protein